MATDFQKNKTFTAENPKIHGEPAIFLKNALRNLKISASDSQIALLIQYANGILKWNKVYQLTAAKTLDDILLHIVDCAAIAPFFADSESPKILDVGSGAGLPGIVLAILKPQSSFFLIDSIQKKTAFLNEAKRFLNLKNVVVLNDRVEKIAGDFDIILCRAFSNLADFVLKTDHLLKPDGAWFAMKGANFKDEIALLPHNVHTEIVALAVPKIAGARHLCILKRSP